MYTKQKVTLPTGVALREASTLATTAATAFSFQLSLLPNPVSGTATVAYVLPAPTTTTLLVQTLLGQTVYQLPAIWQAAGTQTQEVSLQGVAAGIYLVKLQAGDQTLTTRLVVQ